MSYNASYNAKLLSGKCTRVGLGDVVTFVSDVPFVKSKHAWGTIVEISDRGVTGRHMLCRILWHAGPAVKPKHSYHYEYELLKLEEKLAYDALSNNVVNTVR